jgi:FAD/FMN-containing dehydrogenase
VDTATLEQDTLAQLREDFGGQLLQPGDPGYDEARTIYNGMIDRRPTLIARPTGASDVIAAIAYARSVDLPIAVRCGAHSVAGHSVCDDGVLLDLSLMKGVHVDRANGTARANGGVTWGEYDRETQAFGLATPGGRVLSTGVGGFTLGGGYGWISPKYGLTCDNLVSADVVTADGRFLTASENENEDLFWACAAEAGTSASSPRSSSRCIPWGQSSSAGSSSSRWSRPLTCSPPGETSSRKLPMSWQPRRCC